MSIDKNYVPSLYKSTANMTTEEWENERRNSLGGSDIAVILGVSPYNRTKRELFYDKTGVKPAVAKSDNVKQIIFNSGHFLENMVADIFSFRTGLETYEIKAMFEHPLHPHIRGNIDRFYRYKGTKEPLGFLECKTTTEFNSEWNNNKIPPQYSTQIATYMSILNMDKCNISCLFIPEQLRYVAGILFQMKNVFGSLPKNVLGDIKDELLSISDTEMEMYVPTILRAIGGEFLIPKHLLEATSDAIGKKLIIQEVERDEDFERYLLAEADEFWFDYVKKGVLPPLTEDGSACLATLKKYIIPSKFIKPVKLDGSLYEKIEKIEVLKQKKSELNGRIKELDKSIEKLSVPFVEALNGSIFGVLENSDKNVEISYKESERISIPKKNMEKLKTGYPDAFKECATVTVSKPSFKYKCSSK